jgi:putative spermidine/putrescine transport system ATP-binding protein
MTANTTSNAATTAAGTGSARRGGTSVLLQDLTRVFGSTRARDGLSIEIAPGELVALLGPSGCGKTTALRIVAGFETADAGTVLVDGKDMSLVPAARRDMGMVFQSYSLFPNMPALDNVAFGLRMRKMGGSERRKRAAELLDMVGLAPQARQYPHQLSGGQQQRVALARVLAVQVDKPSAEAAALAPGTSVAVSLPARPVLVTTRTGRGLIPHVSLPSQGSACRGSGS